MAAMRSRVFGRVDLHVMDQERYTHKKRTCSPQDSIFNAFASAVKESFVPGAEGGSIFIG